MLKRRFPRARFVWIMGADNLATFDRWHRWREIFTMVPIVVVDRPGWRLKALASKAATEVKEHPVASAAAALGAAAALITLLAATRRKAA